MKILFTICGRAGSKGIKNKNLMDFLGYPLSFYSLSVIDLYTKSYPDIYFDIVLNTDSDDLISLFNRKSNIKVEIIEREPALAVDNASKVDVIFESLFKMEERKKIKYDMVVDLDITSPLRTIKDLENLISKKKNSSADVVFSVTESRRNPYFNMVKKSESGYQRVISSTFNSRQEAPQIYDMNASLYAYSRDFLYERIGIFDGKCDIIEMVDTGVLDLDHENDYILMKVIGEYLFSVNESLKQIRENIEML